MTISEESLSVRDSTSGSLLADFPKAIISTFHLVFEGVVRLDHVDGKTKIAVVITNRLLVDLVKELKDKKFPGIKNSIGKAASSSSAITSSSTDNQSGSKRQRLDTQGNHLSLPELPDVTNDIVAFHALQILMDPQFADFVDGLERIVESVESVAGSSTGSSSSSSSGTDTGTGTGTDTGLWSGESHSPSVVTKSHITTSTTSTDAATTTVDVSVPRRIQLTQDERPQVRGTQTASSNSFASDASKDRDSGRFLSLVRCPQYDEDNDGDIFFGE